MVDTDGDFKKSNRFKEKHNYHFNVLSPAGNIPPIFMTRTIPTTIVIDNSGKIVFQHEGVADYSSTKFIDFMQKIAQHSEAL